MENYKTEVVNAMKANAVNTMKANAKTLRSIINLDAIEEIADNFVIEVFLNDAKDFLRLLEKAAKRAKRACDENSFSDAMEARKQYNIMVDELADTFADIIRAFRC